MNELLAAYPDMGEYYLKLMQIQSALLEVQIADESYASPNTLPDEQFWTRMAEYEKTAPEIDIAKEKHPQGLIQKVVYPPHEKRKMSPLSIVFFAMNAAAILLLFLFIKFAPHKGGIEVATLTDSINAAWADGAGPMEKGTRLAARSREFYLREGLAKLVFDNNAMVVIEGPAEFELLAEDQIKLRHGRVYAAVPREAIGFTISTPQSRIIDLGTEFGVQADPYGDVHLHVIKGKTTLIAGGKSTRVNLEVREGQAKNVSGTTLKVSDVPCETGLFVRDISSDHKFVWKGQPSIDVADIVRNGNGLGTGNSHVRLHPVRGFSNEQHHAGAMDTAKGYLPIKEHPFIDGIFIPDGTTVISTQGDAFENFPATGSLYCCDLLANPVPGILTTASNPACTINFNGQEYSDRGKPCIVMHSNRGITFDLDAIRKFYRSGIGQFTAQIGLANLEDNAASANFYVIVDGRLRYSLLQYNQKDVLNPIAIAIEDEDRFLTLATTDGEGPDASEGRVLNQWCIFAEPVLKLE